MRYLIDRSDSRFTVQAFATGILSAFGHQPTIALIDYEGEILCASEDFDQASLRLTVRTAAMEVLDDMKKDDRQKLEQEMYEKVLEASRFPVAVYTSREITVQTLGSGLYYAHVTGDLSFHGVKRDHSFDGRVSRSETGLRISGEFLLRQSDYGIKTVSFAGGALRLKDEVKFRFELVAEKQE